MGLRERLWSVLSRGEEPQYDPEEFIEVVVVPVAQSALTAALLERNGIEAVTVAQSRYPGGSRLAEVVSIQVRRRESERAAELVEEFA